MRTQHHHHQHHDHDDDIREEHDQDMVTRSKLRRSILAQSKLEIDAFAREIAHETWAAKESLYAISPTARKGQQGYDGSFMKTVDERVMAGNNNMVSSSVGVGVGIGIVRSPRSQKLWNFEIRQDVEEGATTNGGSDNNIDNNEDESIPREIMKDDDNNMDNDDDDDDDDVIMTVSSNYSTVAASIRREMRQLISKQNKSEMEQLNLDAKEMRRRIQHFTPVLKGEGGMRVVVDNVAQHQGNNDRHDRQGIFRNVGSSNDTAIGGNAHGITNGDKKEEDDYMGIELRLTHTQSLDNNDATTTTTTTTTNTEAESPMDEKEAHAKAIAAAQAAATTNTMKRTQELFKPTGNEAIDSIIQKFQLTRMKHESKVVVPANQNNDKLNKFHQRPSPTMQNKTGPIVSSSIKTKLDKSHYCGINEDEHHALKSKSTTKRDDTSHSFPASPRELRMQRVKELKMMRSPQDEEGHYQFTSPTENNTTSGTATATATVTTTTATAASTSSPPPNENKEHNNNNNNNYNNNEDNFKTPNNTEEHNTTNNMTSPPFIHNHDDHEQHLRTVGNRLDHWWKQQKRNQTFEQVNGLTDEEDNDDDDEFMMRQQQRRNGGNNGNGNTMPTPLLIPSLPSSPTSSHQHRHDHNDHQQRDAPPPSPSPPPSQFSIKNAINTTATSTPGLPPPSPRSNNNGNTTNNNNKMRTMMMPNKKKVSNGSKQSIMTTEEHGGGGGGDGDDSSSKRSIRSNNSFRRQGPPCPEGGSIHNTTSTSSTSSTGSIGNHHSISPPTAPSPLPLIKTTTASPATPQAVAHSALDIILARLEEAKSNFKTALLENDVEKQSEMASLIAKLGEAAVAMKKLEQL